MGLLLFLLLVSAVISAIFSGNINNISNACINSSTTATYFAIELCGSMAFWGGIMKIMESSGLCDKLTKLLIRPLSFLFKKDKVSGKSLSFISANITANLLGLSNAATPLGIKAVTSLKQDNPDKHKISKSTARFVLMNTASIQIIPTTIAYIRLSCGSAEPMAIIIPILITSVCSVTAGLLAVEAFFKE